MNASAATHLTPTLTQRLPRARRWLYQSFLELGAYDTAPGSARGHIDSLLREWGLGQHEEAALAVVSELAANSVQATQMCSWVRVPPIRLWLYGDASAVMLAVWDALPGELALPAPAACDDEDGRGLAIVDYFSAEWGTYCPPPPPESYGGKVTWALLLEASSTD